MSDNSTSGGQQVILIIFESINTAVSIVFLVLFAYRFQTLGQFSMTNKYKNFFPYFRIILSVAFLSIGVAILIYNLVQEVYPADQWYDYILQGGGSVCINSIVLIIEMLVLRLELLKQNPYTPCHIYFFLFLAIMSVVRFVLSLVYNDNQDYGQAMTNSVLYGVQLSVSIIQLCTWIIKKQSLPKFQDNIEVNINILNNTEEGGIYRADFQSQKNYTRNDDDFPYIMPFLAVQNGKIRIVLEAIPKCTRTQVEQSNVQSKYHSMYLSPLRKPLSSEKERTRTSQFISVTSYTLDELKQFYVLCGRFPIKKRVDFDEGQLQKIARQFQQFLEQLLQQKMWYQTIILKYLKIPLNYLQTYQDLMQKNSSMNLQSDIDQTIGMKLIDDKNSIYCSLLIFRHLWISDHYEFYMKVFIISTHKIAYPIKRYSEFEDLHQSLKFTIKQLGKPLQLPSLPKKQLFLWNQDNEVLKRRSDLQRYLKKLCNDSNFMQIPAIRTKIFHFLQVQDDIQLQGKFQTQFYQDLKIIKGQITKALVKNDYITFYQFKLFRNGIEIKTLTKRYSQFEDLHQQIQRWMNNIQITYQFLKIPEKVYYKSQSIRHQKLKIYLEKLVQVRDIGKVYAVNTFFNIRDDQMSENMSSLSIIHPQNMSRKSRDSNVFSGVIELQENIILRRESKSSVSSRQFSMMLDDLGNPIYD